MSPGQILPWLLIVPLATALATVVVPARWRRAASLPALVVLPVLAMALLSALVAHGSQAYALGGHATPLGISLFVDGPAAFLILLTAMIGAACGAHAAASLRGQAAEAHFWPLVWFLWAALNAIWLSADLFNQYVGIELLGLAAVGLVALKGSAEALAAAMRYLLAALLGSLAWLLGVALLYGTYGTLALADIQALAAPGATTTVALALMTLGMLLKTALFPLHAWLPPAHAGALPPVSALLSALVIKASFFILLRLWFTLGPDTTAVALAWVLGLLGTGAVFWGGWMAWRQTQLKHLVAYSTVAQIGYLFLFFPLATATAPLAAGLAWDGTMLMLASHALAKAAMFLAAGNLVLAMGSPRIVDLCGIGRFRPLSLLGFGLAGVSIMGLPPSGGFTAKWLLLQSALASGQWGWIAVLVLGGLLSAAYVFKVFRHSFVEGPKRDPFESPPLVLELAALALALAAIAIGLAAHAPLSWLRLGTAFGAPG